MDIGYVRVSSCGQHTERQLEGVRRATVQPCAQSGRTSVQLQFHREMEPERRLFALLSGMNIPILHLSRVGDSLEQVFLNVISQ